MDDNKMHNVSREQFEKFSLSAKGGLLAGHLVKDEDGAYLNYAIQYYWEFWQESRKSLVIELPEKSREGNGYCSAEPFEHYGDGWDECLDNVVALIEAQGLKVSP